MVWNRSASIADANTPANTWKIDAAGNGAVAFQNVSTSGTIIATNGVVTQTLTEAESFSTFNITGTWNGQVAFLGSEDGITFDSLEVVSLASTTNTAITATAANGEFRAPVPGLVAIQAEGILWSSGTANITITSSPAAGLVEMVGAIPPGANTIGTVNISASSPGGSIATAAYVAQPDAVTTGSLTTTNSVFDVFMNTGQSVVVVQVLGTWSGTISFEASEDSSSFGFISAFNSAFTKVSTTTTNGMFIIPAGGYQKIRLQMTTYVNGTANISANSSHATPIQFAALDGARPTNTNQAFSAQGSAGDLGLTMLSLDTHKGRGSKTTFETGSFLSFTPIAAANGVYSWKNIQTWPFSNLNPYFWFIPKILSAAISAAGCFIRAGEKTELANWVANGSTAGTFTQGGTGINNADVWTDVFLEIIVSFSTTARTFSITYFDETGSSHVASVTVPASTAVATRIQVPLVTTAEGLLNISNITCTTSPAASAQLTVWGFKTVGVVGSMTGSAAASTEVHDMSIGAWTNNRAGNTYVAIEGTATATTALLVWAALSGVSTSQHFYLD